MDGSKSLQELESEEWDEPNDPTFLTRRCHELRRLPLQGLSAEDCRLLIGQNIGVLFLVPLAIEFLHENPLEGGEVGPGALLDYILQLQASFWADHPDLWWEVKEILHEVECLREGLERLAPATREFELLERSIANLTAPKQQS